MSINKLSAVLLLTLSLSGATLQAAQLPSARPAEQGFDEARLAQISQKMKAFVEQEKLSGAVTLVARNGRIVHLEAVGQSDREQHRPMRKDSIFWIASQTKSIISTAAQILVDEGKLSWDDPASKYIPDFKNTTLRTGKPAHEVTLRQLTNHTSGLLKQDRIPADGTGTLAQYALDLAHGPLEFEPGSRYMYNYGLTVLGRVIEIASGQSLETYLDERIFRPLAMKDTTFNPNVEQRRRIVKTYQPGPDGKGIAPAFNPFVTVDPTIVRTPEPSGGLFSTASDMARFYQMIANGGELEGHRILPAAGIETIVQPQTAGGKIIDYALGWQTRRAPGAEGAAPPAEFGHGGAFGTDGWIDRSQGLVLVLMIQRTRYPQGGEVRAAFHEAARAALTNPGARAAAAGTRR